MPELVVTLMILAMSAAVVYPAMRICRRVGLPPLLGLLAIVPLVNVALLWFVAVTPWPAVERANSSM